MALSFPRSHRKAENVFQPRTDLLFTMPFTASPTNAIEMNNAMTSSVDLEKNRNIQLGLMYSSMASSVFMLYDIQTKKSPMLQNMIYQYWCMPESSENISKSYLELLVQFHLLKSFMNKLMLNKPPRIRNRLFHKPMQA